MPTPGVGEDIEDICTRCGDTWHVVMAKVGDKVAKVVCKLCGSQHNYRGDKQASSAGGSAKNSWSLSRKRRPTKATSVTSAPVVFDPTKPPRAYTPKDAYQVGERVTHRTFGIGVVGTVPAPGKVEVHFPGGLRTLACAKAASTLERPVAVHNLELPDHPPVPKASQGNGSGD
jgi:hypothetical protein